MSNLPAFIYLKATKTIIDFKSLISNDISYQKAPNSIFQPADMKVIINIVYTNVSKICGFNDYLICKLKFAIKFFIFKD